MKNKIFIKIGSVFIFAIIFYLFFMNSLISPKITNYFIDFETNQVKNQLNKVFYIVKSKANQLKDFEELKYQDHKAEIKEVSNIAYLIAKSHFEMYQKGLYTKKEASENILSILSKIKYSHSNYLYVINSKGDVLYHPNKEYKNKNVYNKKDVLGKDFVPTLIANVIENKETFSSYSWTNKDKTITNKIAYSIYFKPLDMIITSFVNEADIQKEINIQKRKLVSKLTDLLDTFITKEDGYIFVLDKEFKIVMHPNKTLINENFHSKKYKNIIDVEKLKNDIKNANSNDTVWEYNWNTKNDLENYNYKKYGWVAYNDYFDWYIISSIYEKQLEEKAKEIESIVVNLSIVLLFILMSIAIFFVRKVLKPIDELSHNVRVVREGNLDVRTKIDTNDELGELSKHFNRMLDVIQDNTKNLEKKIEERTKEIERKLYFDELTGLQNRESLIESIKDEEFVAVSFIDINNFDDINELYGFEVGNEVLIQITQRLKKFAASNNLELFRVNGDIFALKDVSIIRFVSYEKLIDKIHEIFVKEFKLDSLGVDLYLSVTLGVSISQNQPVKSANTALKKAKQTGLRTVVYNRNIDVKDNIEKMMYWKEKIKNAIDEDKVIPFFQPIFDKNENLIKYETLMRIEEVDSEGKSKYLSPGSFFDVAIKTKQYFTLNQIVIEKAFRNIDKIGKLVSVNISFSDILNFDFMEFIEKQVKLLSQEQREKVVFEILESDFISDHEVLDDFILRFKKEGIKFAIDDFGTGYSNFTHVLNIKPEYIKIDGSLIKDIDKDQTSYEMVKSIIDFCKSLKIIVVVEFIHNETVYKILQDLDADEYQGFYLGEPKPLF